MMSFLFGKINLKSSDFNSNFLTSYFGALFCPLLDIHEVKYS